MYYVWDSTVLYKRHYATNSNNNATVMRAMDHIEILKDRLLALKEGSGQTLKKFWASYDIDGSYKGVKVIKNEGDNAKFTNCRCQFFQALHDNTSQRFPYTDFITAARVLCKETLPADPLQKALYGDSEIAMLCKSFNISSTLAADILLDFAVFKRTGEVGKALNVLMDLLAVLPISSAECKRGFSQMNLIHTSDRNRLLTDTVSDLMMICINGPPLRSCNAIKYVLSWLKSGRHGALYKATGVCRKTEEAPTSTLLFA